MQRKYMFVVYRISEMFYKNLFPNYNVSFGGEFTGSTQIFWIFIDSLGFLLSIGLCPINILCIAAQNKLPHYESSIKQQLQALQTFDENNEPIYFMDLLKFKTTVHML